MAAVHNRYADTAFFTDSDVESIEAPPFSPFSVGDVEEVNNIDEESDVENIEAPPFSPLGVGDAEKVGLETRASVDDEDVSLEQRLTTSMPSASNNSEETTRTVSRVCNSYKIVIDNLDKNFRASYQRIDRTTQSFHCVHAYAVLDRVDFSGLSDRITGIQTPVDLNSLLPNTADLASVEEHLKVLISR